MKHVLEQMLSRARSASHKLSDNLKNKFEQLKSNKVTVSDLATLILLHPETKITRSEYLSLVFHDCWLVVDDYKLYLETKGGRHEKVLQCKIIHDGKVISSFHSYSSKSKLRDKIKIPDGIHV
ncbi:hypothetical protein [Salirhabdus salicampi]|uniref:hypothetical protein n=1 Tax=Salirhabdus salicampi TaxID=476102 RepID=UPI0020C4CC80|nr:hypothetical protein [Salirhabdus salicampi]MCP8615724.1 hypothetical protein [Salirhabdus salicampi]